MRKKELVCLKELEFDLEYSKMFGSTSFQGPRNQDGAGRPRVRKPRRSQP